MVVGGSGVNFEINKARKYDEKGDILKTLMKTESYKDDIHFTLDRKARISYI
jgi:hypothetical protein